VVWNYSVAKTLAQRTTLGDEKTSMHNNRHKNSLAVKKSAALFKMAGVKKVLKSKGVDKN